MHELTGHFLTTLLGFTAIMNPIANTPIFLGLTADDDPKTRRRIAINAIILTFALIVVFCFAGKLIFELFGITLSAFRIAGGVLVALIGYNMLHGEQSKVQNPTAGDRQDSIQAKLSVAVSPLAVPILAGPGTIATAMSFAADGGIDHVIVTIIAFGLLCGVTFVCFIFGQDLVKVLGQNGLNVVTRMMGLILAVIGVQMLIEGIKGAFKLAS